MRLKTGICAGVAGAVCCSAWLFAAASGASLADAVKTGDREAATSLLKEGTDVNAAGADGMTALHWAALNGDAALVETLIHAGANLDARTRLGAYTPLDIAAQNGDGAVVAALLKGGANANEANAFGTTPLMLAAASGNISAVTGLLDAGADVNAAESTKHETPLMLAAANDRVDAMRVLLQHGADWRPTTTVTDWRKISTTDPRLPHLADEAAQAAEAKANGKGSGEPPTARYPRLVGTQGGLTALLFAARQGYADGAATLLKGGADVNEIDPGDHTSPLMMAIVNGHFDLAEQLLAAGADPNQAQINGATPAYAVINTEWYPKADYPQPTAYKQQSTSYLTLLEDLLKHGADPNARLREKVWYTSYNRDYSGLDESGATPFWAAAYADDIAAMKLLVRYGADPNITTIKTAALGVYQSKYKDMSGVPTVPVGGPDIPAILAASGQEYGSSLTAGKHRYAPTGMLAAVKYLVEDLHADVNARDANGNTALHNAASRGDNDMIRYLVSKGADITAVNRKGQTVADMANGPFQRIDPFPETIALAEKLGAKLLHKCVSCGS